MYPKQMDAMILLQYLLVCVLCIVLFISLVLLQRLIMYCGIITKFKIEHPYQHLNVEVFWP